ncbi:MAG: ferritin [Candidatus Kapaibacteriota bacterium]
MIKETLQKAINEQIVREMYSSNLYLSMAAYYATINLNGFANWMRVQAEEELTHALKFFDYVIDRGGKAVVGAIPAPTIEWKDEIKPFEDAYEHEQKVTNWINELMDLATQEKDYALISFLNWFIDEQVEEEKNTSEILDRLHLAGGSKASLFLLDNELKTRTFTPPTTNA